MTSFNILIIAQSGRLQYEAALFAASLRAKSPDFKGKLFVAHPAAGPLWSGQPGISNDAVLELLGKLDVQVVSFDSDVFGAAYPQGNKIEALKILPKGEPFVFFDSDTLVLDELMQVPFDFNRPSASLKVEGTWPNIELYGPGYAEIWKSLYDKFGLDFDSALDLSQPDEHWQRYPYYNAGFFYFRCPHEFGSLFLSYATAIRDDPPEELALQSLTPWLDQVALPLVIHKLGGGRDALEPGWLDGKTTCHYRILPLLYAREDDRVVDVLESVAAPNKVKKVLKSWETMKRFVYQNRGQKARALFDRADLPRKEQAIRNRLRREGFWMR